MPQSIEEGLADNYAHNASDLISFYHNQGEYGDSTASKLTSWAYANSSLGGEYQLSNNYVNNFYNNTAATASSSSLIANNYKAATADRNKIETFPLETIPDALNVGYDLAKIAYGKYTNNPELTKEGKIDLILDSGALATPYLPAGASKVARLLGKGEKVITISQKDNVINNINDSAAGREASNFDIYIKREGKVQEDLNIWPPNNGFYGAVNKNDTLMPGYQFDRYGDNSGIFAAPKDASFEGRSLPSYYINKDKGIYEVIKPIPNVQTGISTPWFGQKGQETQHLLPSKIKDLELQGFIKQISKN